MKEITNAIKQLTDIYKSSLSPDWVNIICGILLPLVISIIVIFQNKKINKNNERLQENIYNHEVRNKKYDIILNSYVAYIDVVQSLPLSKEGLNCLSNNNPIVTEIITNIINARERILLETKKLKLLLKNDIELITTIEQLNTLYQEIANDITFDVVKKTKINTDNVFEKIRQYQQLVESENYDKLFEKYLTIDEIWFWEH